MDKGQKYEKWDKVTVEELCAYMGFMLLMGIVHLPSMITAKMTKYNITLSRQNLL